MKSLPKSPLLWPVAMVLISALLLLINSVDSVVLPQPRVGEQTTAAMPAAIASSAGARVIDLASTGALHRRDLPPDAVNRILVWNPQGVSGSLGPGCDVYAGRSGLQGTRLADPFYISGCYAIVPDRVRLDFHDFVAGEQITTEITAPNGSRVTRQLIADDAGNASWEQLALTSDQVGTYLVRAIQGRFQASAAFLMLALQPASHKLLITPDKGTPGTHFTVALGGFPPKEDVQLYLYARLPASSPYATASYATRLGSALTSDKGEALVVLETGPRDPEGEYIVATNYPQGANWFAISDTRTVSSQCTFREPTADDPMLNTVIDEANRVWASVVAHNGAPLDHLNLVYGEPILSQLRSESTNMRARGQYREARRVSFQPASLHVFHYENGSANQEKYELTVQERWADRIFNTNGDVAMDLPEYRAWTYQIELATSLLAPTGWTWLITRAGPVATGGVEVVTSAGASLERPEDPSNRTELPFDRQQLSSAVPQSSSDQAGRSTC